MNVAKTVIQTLAENIKDDEDTYTTLMGVGLSIVATAIGYEHQRHGKTREAILAMNELLREELDDVVNRYALNKGRSK